MLLAAAVCSCFFPHLGVEKSPAQNYSDESTRHAQMAVTDSSRGDIELYGIRHKAYAIWYLVLDSP